MRGHCLMLPKPAYLAELNQFDLSIISPSCPKKNRKRAGPCLLRPAATAKTHRVAIFF